MSQSINISSGSRKTRLKRTRYVPAKATRVRRVAPTRTIVKYVPRQGEKKFFDRSFSVATAITWALQDAQALFIPGEGTSNKLRIGNKVNVISLHCRFILQLAQLEAQAAPLNQIVTRVLIGHSHDGSMPAVGDIVDIAGSTTDLLSWRNMDNTQEFSILSDFYLKIQPFNLNEGAINSFAHGANNSEVVRFNKLWKKPLKAQFKSGTVTPSANNFFIMAISTSLGATLNVEIRTRYTDL